MGNQIIASYGALKTLQTETSYVVSGKEINRDIESSGERNQLKKKIKILDFRKIKGI